MNSQMIFISYWQWFWDRHRSRSGTPTRLCSPPQCSCSIWAHGLQLQPGQQSMQEAVSFGQSLFFEVLTSRRWARNKKICGLLDDLQALKLLRCYVLVSFPVYRVCQTSSSRCVALLTKLSQPGARYFTDPCICDTTKWEVAIIQCNGTIWILRACSFGLHATDNINSEKICCGFSALMKRWWTRRIVEDYCLINWYWFWKNAGDSSQDLQVIYYVVVQHGE